MGRFEEYVEKQEQVINVAGERISLAHHLSQNILKPEFFLHTPLRIHNINFPEGEGSVGALREKLIESDPVYAKLSEAMKEINRTGTAHEGIIHGIINDLQIDIENRKMNEEMYTYLFKTSKYNLIQNWIKKIDEETIPF